MDETNKNICKIYFTGERVDSSFIQQWMELQKICMPEGNNLIVWDCMKGKIEINAVILLSEMLSKYRFYFSNRIAVVLEEENSYNKKLFDVMLKNYGIKMKHFTTQKGANEWLCE